MRYGAALLDVQKPGRYEGLEAGAVVKPWEAVDLHVALCFPDVYEIGMSHLGLGVLYHVLNGRAEVSAERCYAPWMDMEELLRRRGWPLVTRESGRPLRDFELVGFTLQYELCAGNVLLMLELGGIPLRASERGEDDPVVLGGGPVAANPEPLAEFFDALFIGEGEEGVLEIAETLRTAGGSRSDRLAALAEVPGVYVPAFHTPRYEGGVFAGFDEPAAVQGRTVADLERVSPPARPLVPFISTVHDRLAVELARGCTRGCRFCQAGFLYRPVRERSPGSVRRSVRDGLAATGFDELGMLSLSTGDYSCIGPLLVRLMDEHVDEKVAVSLPSLRVDSLEPRLLQEVSRVRKTGFTIAPEAGTARLRRVVNKNLTEEDVLAAAERIFSAGWKAVKLYFMIGLPTETPEDRQGIVELARQVARQAPPGRGRVTVSISNFVPKAHTPFQWCRQLGVEEIRAAQEFFKRELKDKKIELKWHDAEMSVWEGVLARGDRRLGPVILDAYRRGCRMDAWTGEFRGDLWREALASHDLELETFLAERPTDRPLPWDGVRVGADRAYLLAEWERARMERETGDCRNGECRGCGLCDFRALQPRLAGPEDYPECRSVDAGPEPIPDFGDLPRVRLRYRKTGAAGLLSHLEVVTALHRALRAAEVPLVYSQGHHPHPKLTLGPALPLGTESLVELADVKVWQMPPLRETVARANRCLPEGLVVEAAWRMEAAGRRLSGGDTSEEYHLTLTEEAAEAADAGGGLNALAESYWRDPDCHVVKKRKNKPDRVLDARDFVEAFWAERNGLVVRLRRHADGSMLGPEELVRHLLGPDAPPRVCERILKTRAEPVF